MQLLRGETIPSGGEGSSGDECARHVLDVTPPMIRAIRELMRKHRLRDLTVPQFRAMGLLSRSPKATLSQVADHVGCSLPAASRMIDVLVARKLVARHQCNDDRRQVSLALTARGNSAFCASRQATRGQLAERLAALSPAKRRSVVEAMSCLAEIFGSDCDQRLPADGHVAATGRRNGPRKSARSA